ncbi:MAG: VCBS domain-containing protein, partial [Planctomycetales bacterium]|nr:VCBS domain-containing protein [Planctomycetales bacterium]
MLDNDAVISDPELDALNSGQGNYAGASITLVRSGGASTQDQFSVLDGNGISNLAYSYGGPFFYELEKNGHTIATLDFDSQAGALTITFTDANGEVPTSTDVVNVLRQVAYRNSSDAPPASVVLGWTFSDGNTGAQGTGGALSASGNTTVTITAENDAPVLDTNGVFTLTSISEDQTANSGQTVASIVSSGGGDRITDPDNGSMEGIAITALSSGNGTWQYSIDGGSNWNDIGSVSDSQSLLLRSTDWVRFVPNGQNATTADFTFRAWDQTSGSSGVKVNTATNGGSTPFSSATDVASITVTAVNDNPSAVSDTATAVEAGGASNGTAGTNPTGNVLTNDTDVDAGDTMAVVGVVAGPAASAVGSVGTGVTGAYGSLTINSDGSYTYTVDNNNATVQALRNSSQTLTDNFTYTMSDALNAISTAEITITIEGANDNPHDLTSGPLTIDENAANITVVGTVTASDVDNGDTASYSLVDNAGGRFAINASTGEISVANGSLLNYEDATSHSVTVRVIDTLGATYDESFTIAVTDVAGDPV